MTATGHAIIGTVIATKIGNPYLALPLALVSHIAADAFPHWDTGTNYKKKSGTKLLIESFIDVAISLTLIPLILGPFLNPSINYAYLYLVIFTAQFFDWITAPYFFFKIKIPPFTWAYRFQKMFDNRLDKPWGIIGQATVLLLLIILAKIL